MKLHFWVPNLFQFKGGIQTYLLDVLTVLIEAYAGHQVDIIDKLDQKLPEDLELPPGFTLCFSGGQPRGLVASAFVLQLVSRAIWGRPQLILCGHVNYAPVAHWLSRLLNIPYWVFVYGIEVWGLQSSSKIKALDHAAKIICISNYTRDRLIKEQNLSPQQFALLPVTFHASCYSIAAKPESLLQRYGLSHDQPVILTVARLSQTERYKGYDRILQALPTIRQTLPTVHYLLVGKGDDLPRVEALVDQLGLRDWVTLTGFVPDQELTAHYQLCDVFAMPSKKEGFGIVYLEALACGKPTLGGNQDGALDALCQGELGALVDPDNLEALAHTLTEMLQGTYPNPLIYQPEQLRQRVIDTYGFERFKAILKGYLDEFIEANPDRGFR